MGENPDQPETVLEAIAKWSESRPLWLRDALRRVVQQRTITDQDHDQIAILCHQEYGYKQNGDAPSVAVPLAVDDLPVTPSAGASVTLSSIAEVQFANLLAPNQTLSIAPQGLTIIYGDNGSGKSGYGRILKRSCRARNRGEEIAADIYGAGTPRKASAKLQFKVGTSDKAVSWSDGPSPMIGELSAISVFDADCAEVHVEKKNEVAFRPFGLDVPERLATVCQRLKTTLEQLKRTLEAERAPEFKLPTWSPTTVVGKLISALRHDSDYIALENLASLSETEVTRLNQLREDLAKDPAVASKELRLRIGRLKNLAGYVENIENEMSDAKLAELMDLVRESRRKKEVAQTAAAKLFANAPLAGIGSETWRELWESARRYSEQTAYPERKFPHTTEDARCVLCQQPISPEASDQLSKLEDFVKADTERQAREAQNKAKVAWDSLKTARVGTGPCRESLEEFAHHATTVAADIRRYVVVAALRKRSVLRSINNKDDASPPPAVDSSRSQLLAFIETETARAVELEKAAVNTERAKLKSEHLELHDRALLKDLLPTIKKEIERLKEAEALEKCIAATNTKAITDLGSGLAEQVLTPQLRDRFAQELITLAGSRVRAELTYAGGRTGIPQYQVRLIAKPSANIADVLSEGEATCVALAGFLTELATAEHRSSLIFDDPVCSLDHKWRLKVAKRLVKEAAARQVLVFTHDIVFVHDLHDQAAAQSVPCELRNLRRDSTGTGVVGEGLPWIGMRIEQRLDELGKRSRAAKSLFDAHKDDEYNKEVEHIYSDLRATWERALEDVAFQRTVIRHRDYINTKDLKKVSVLTEVDCEDFRKHFDRCSDVVNSHDRSTGRNPEHPEPTELLSDIKNLEDWVRSLRDRHKSLN